MLKKLAPLFAVLLLGGLIVSCSTTSSSPLLNKAQNFIKSDQYDSTLAAAGKFIQTAPGNPLGYFYKGEALGLKGSEVDLSTPKKATPLYKGMDKAFTKAKQIADTMSEPPSILQRIDPVRSSLWREEHNVGVNFARPDSLHNTVDNPLEVAIGHLQNATIAQPDCAITWNALAQVSGMKKQYKQAAKAQQKYLSLADSTTSRNYLVLAQYYNLSNQPKKALPVLEKAHQQFPDSIKPVEMLADTYRKLGKADKSVSIVKELVQRDPSNGRYRMSLGVKIYQKQIKLQNKYDDYMNKIMSLQGKKMNATGDQSKQLQQQIDQVKAKASSLKNKMDELNQRAVKQINAAISNGKKDASVYNALGVIYLNKAHVIFKKRNVTLDNAKAKELNEKAMVQLKKSRDYYKKATQLDPNNKSYWQSLYQVYTALGNDQKAEMAKQKAGIK